MSEPDKWIPIDSTKINQVREVVLNGVHVKVMVPFQDVPVAVRGTLDKISRHFLIDFKYSGDDEHTRVIDHDQNVKVSVGRESNRLYQIDLDVSVMKTKSVGLTLTVREEVSLKIIDAIEKIGAQRKQARREANFEIVKKVIVDNQRVFRDLAVAG